MNSLITSEIAEFSRNRMGGKHLAVLAILIMCIALFYGGVGLRSESPRVSIETEVTKTIEMVEVNELSNSFSSKDPRIVNSMVGGLKNLKTGELILFGQPWNYKVQEVTRPWVEGGKICYKNNLDEEETCSRLEDIAGEVYGFVFESDVPES